MQIQIQAFLNKKEKCESLRERIINDLNNYDRKFTIVRCKKKGLNPGWAKIKYPGFLGVINVEWHNDQRMLVARAITRGDHNTPHKLLGLFVTFLLAQYEEVQAINMQL